MSNLVDDNILLCYDVQIFVIIDAFVKIFRTVDFDNSVCDGIHKLLVVRGEQHTALEILHSVVQGGYTL